MSRVVYLHVGAPKTGTTYVQGRLRLNRKELAKHGLHYPLGVYASQFNAALDLIDEPWGGVRAEVNGQWEALARRVRRREGTVIVDHEILAAATPDQVHRAMDDLSGSEIHIVYSARDLARQIPAEWQEGIKHQGRRSFRRFTNLLMQPPREGTRMWFWRVQDLVDVLSRWSAGLPPSQVHLVTVPQPGAPRDLLWQRICGVFGIDLEWAPKDGAFENPSIGMAEAQVIRRLNARLAGSDIPFRERQSLVKELLVHRTLSRREDMTKPTLPPAMYPWAEEITERWIEWVEGSRIDVVGDLDELRPVRPDPEDEWVNPDRPNPRAMLDAAIEALAVMTEEAARRPSPEEQLAAKVGRAARQLRGE